MEAVAEGIEEEAAAVEADEEEEETTGAAEPGVRRLDQSRNFAWLSVTRQGALIV